MFVTRHIVEQFNPLEMAVVLFADLYLQAIKVALEGNGLVDFKLAEKKRGYVRAIGFHELSRDISQMRPLILTRLARISLKSL
jgi:hypothetical protein